jgi:hypothetical protein
VQPQLANLIPFCFPKLPSESWSKDCLGQKHFLHVPQAEAGISIEAPGGGVWAKKEVLLLGFTFPVCTETTAGKEDQQVGLSSTFC